MTNPRQAVPAPPGRIGPLPIVLLMLSVVLGDQLTKWWIMQAFRPGEILVVVPRFFNLTYVTNTGAAFGFLAGQAGGWRQLFFVTVALVALVIVAFALRHYRDKGGLFVYGLAAIGSGAVGNLIDRVRFGAVVDFLDFYVGAYHWPAFNVADSAITIGVGFFMLGTFLAPPE